MPFLRIAQVIMVSIVLSLTVGSFLVHTESDIRDVAGIDTKIQELNIQIEQKQSKVKKLEHSIEQVRREIEVRRREEVSLDNQLGLLTNRAKQVELEIESAEEKIDELGLEMEALTLDIAEKEAQITKHKRLMAEFIRTIYYEGDMSYIEILAAYDTFSDFYNRIQYLERVEEDLTTSAHSLKLASASLTERREQKQQIQANYTGLKKELDEKKQDYDEQIAVKDGLLKQTKLSKQVQTTLLTNLRAQYREIADEISGFEREVRKQLEEQDKLKRIEDGVAAGKLSWPTDGRYITARFHDPDYPYRHVFEHNAIDIRAKHGTPLHAAAAGYVARAKHCSSWRCYSYTLLIHNGGISTLYGHMSRITVGEGQYVNRGDIIGYSGGTPGTTGAGPFVTGAHLHFEVIVGGTHVNPLDHLVRDWE